MPRALDIARIATVFLALALVAGEAWAQAGPTTLQFSFSNPGARSLGLGGSFVIRLISLVQQLPCSPIECPCDIAVRERIVVDNT